MAKIHSNQGAKGFESLRVEGVRVEVVEFFRFWFLQSLPPHSSLFQVKRICVMLALLSKKGK